MAADGTVKILIQADGDEAISSVDDLVTRLDGIGGAGKKAGGILKSVLGANLISNAVISGVGMLKDGLVGMIGDLSSASATWKTFNANMKNIGMPDAQIKSTTKQLKKFAQQTIYSSADMSSTFSQLRAVGTKNTMQLIKGFGGLAAAADDPAQAMKSLSQQATQMAGKPMVQWQDFQIMLEQSPAGMAAVARSMGKTTSQLIKDIQAGKVTTQSFFDAVNKAGNAPGFQKMATQYKSVGQAVDGLKETLTNKLLTAFNKVNSVAITAISKIVDAVGNMDFTGVANAAVAAMNGIANAISFMVKHADELKAAGVAVVAFLAVFKGIQIIMNFQKAVQDAGTILAAFQKALGVGPWGLVAAAVAALVVGLTYFFTKTKTGQAVWAKFVSWISKAAAPLAAVAAAVSNFIKSGIDRLGPLLASVGTAVGGFITGGLNRIGPMMASMGGAFGKAGALIGPVISILTKVGTAALGITGPFGIVISVIAAFLGMWAKTGQLNADGITQVFTGLTSTISGFASMVSQYLPQIVAVGTQLLVSLISGITAALPTIVTAATGIINTLVAGFTTALPVLITTALTIMTALLNGLIAALPTIITAGVQILTALINGIITMLPMIITAAMQIIMALVSALVSALPQIITAGIKILTALINGIISILPALINAAVRIVLALAKALIDNLPKIINAGVQLLTALINGLIKMLPALIGGALRIVVALAGALVKNAPRILSAGVKLISALIKGILSLLGQVGSAAVKLGAKVVSSVTSKAKSMANAGVDFVKGFINGIGSMVGNVVKTAESLGRKAVDGVKKFLHIGSPSKVMRQMGVWTGQGFTNGIRDMLPKVSQMSDKMAAAAMFDTPNVALGSVSGSVYAGTTRAEQLISGMNQSVPSSQTINNYTTTNNNSNDSATNKTLALLQQIADKSPVIDANSLAGGMAPYTSAKTAQRNKVAQRGGAVIARIQ